ncbi:hypothetical protein HL666_29795 [Bradyrhizobium sp. 83002]|uniref:hypothetical protein n=1 Tax=Bradyrhizobium aeschynomenes TaxID=2734909 RepID=UPI001552E405|nr:hypothetical protein [Bradyrhizobium aeschynomenes]NPU14976.1 hypothetical protein [Bradyrhizobium aeschynomenes]
MEQIEEVVQNDIDPDFLKSVCILMGWAYPDLFAELVAIHGVDDAYAQETFARRRSEAAVLALVRAARLHGIPYEYKRLSCNGQSKLLLRIGRVVLMQEPILTLSDEPRVSDYKQELADSHGLIRQLELDLGDRPVRNSDWSGCVLAVMLHGSAGPRFTSEHKSLGALMLAVPDAHYSQWVLRLDLHTMATEGRGFDSHDGQESLSRQSDNVRVTLKRRYSERESGA